MEFDYDVAVIGAGSSGMSAYKAAKKEGKKACVIESGLYGTKCATYGCMPSKLLIAASDVAHNVTTASHFGIKVDDIAVDRSAVMRRVRSERERFVNFVKDDIRDFPDKDKILGRYEFQDDHTLHSKLAERTITAKTFVIATGSVPFVPKVLRPILSEDVVYDTEDFFNLHILPKSVAVIGSGVIGMELGQALSRLGVKTTILGVRNNIGTLKDPDVLEKANEIFHEELNLYNNAEVTNAYIVKENYDRKVVVCWNENGTEHSDEFELILNATGTRPNVLGLELINTSVQLDENKVPVFDLNTLECLRIDEEPPNIFVAGDVMRYREILHEAILEGQHAGWNAANYLKIKERKIRVPLSVMFTDPQVMTVGQTYPDLEQGSYAVGIADYADQGRSRIMLKNRGMLHMYFSALGGRMLLGAEMCGPYAEFFGAWFATMIKRAMTVDDILEEPFYHPTVFESVRTACRDAKKSLDILEKI